VSHLREAALLAVAVAAGGLGKKKGKRHNPFIGERSTIKEEDSIRNVSLQDFECSSSSKVQAKKGSTASTCSPRSDRSVEEDRRRGDGSCGARAPIPEGGGSAAAGGAKNREQRLRAVFLQKKPTMERDAREEPEFRNRAIFKSESHIYERRVADHVR